MILFLSSRRVLRQVYHIRPVKLAELDETKLNVSSLVLQE